MNIDRLLATGAPPIVAILRGITPGECALVGAALCEAGLRFIEVPLNSPDPLVSISVLAASCGERCIVGAGTVLSVNAVDAVVAAGGRLIVTPTIDRSVITRAIAAGAEVMPGFVTPTEAFEAIAAGATRLKLFPAIGLGTPYFKALREIVPANVTVWPVGGVDSGNLATWLDAGAAGIGVGGAVFKPGVSASAVFDRARDLVAAWRLWQAKSN